MVKLRAGEHEADGQVVRDNRLGVNTAAGDLFRLPAISLEAGDRLMRSWCQLYRQHVRYGGEGDWLDDSYFVKARLQGHCHKVFVVPQPPFRLFEPMMHAIVDWQDDGGPHTRVEIRAGYPSFHIALRVAATEVADENERECA